MKLKVDLEVVSEGWALDDTEAKVLKLMTFYRSRVLEGGSSAILTQADITPRSDIPQIVVAHEFGHMIGLNHPSFGLPGIVRNDSSAEYNEPGTNQLSPSIMGAGMQLRPEHLEQWANAINKKYMCGYYIK